MHSELHDLPIELEQGALVTRYAEWDEMAVRYARLPAGTDMSPVLTGLPDDRCPSPHWGIVLEGEITVLHADGSQETVGAGQAYHWPSGHTAWVERDTAFLEVGPVAPMSQFGRHAAAQLG